MKLSLLLVCLVMHASALRIASSVDRRTALAAGAASLLPLFAAGKVNAVTNYAKAEFDASGKYVGKSVVGAAPTFEDEEKFEEIYVEAVKKQEKVVQNMGFDMDDSDRKELEMLLRTQYCGFQAKLKCKGSPAAKNGGR